MAEIKRALSLHWAVVTDCVHTGDQLLWKQALASTLRPQLEQAQRKKGSLFCL